MIQILLTLIIYGLIFWLLFWLINYIGIPEPFHKAFKVILAVAAVIAIIGLLTGSIDTFPILK